MEALLIYCLIVWVIFGECVTVDILYNLKNPQVEALLIDQLLGDIRLVCEGG